MNSFTYLFLTLLAISTLIQFWLMARQQRHVQRFQGSVPEDFKENITLEAHQRAAHYTLTKLRLARAEEILSVSILILWTLGGWLEWIDQWTNQFHLSEPLHGLLFIGTFMLISQIIDLPISYYQTFNIEQKFDFNRSTKALFFSDQAKQLMLGLLLMLPIAWVLLWCLAQLGQYWWLYAFVFWVAFVLFITWAYPSFIAQWFNKFTEMKEGSVKARIQALLRKAGFESNGIFIMDGSRRSAHGNAYFTGFGKSKRIVFFDTLLEHLNENEVEAVLAHELGHFKNNHIIKRLAMMIFSSFIAFALLGWLINQPWFFQGLGVSQPSNHVALILFLLTAPVFNFFFQPISSLWSRKHEFEADAYAASVSHADYLIHGLVKLYKENAATLTPDPLYSAFHDSHPPAAVRIAHLRQISAHE